MGSWISFLSVLRSQIVPKVSEHQEKKSKKNTSRRRAASKSGCARNTVNTIKHACLTNIRIQKHNQINQKHQWTFNYKTRVENRGVSRPHVGWFVVDLGVFWSQNGSNSDSKTGLMFEAKNGCQKIRPTDASKSSFPSLTVGLLGAGARRGVGG